MLSKRIHSDKITLNDALKQRIKETDIYVRLSTTNRIKIWLFGRRIKALKRRSKIVSFQSIDRRYLSSPLGNLGGDEIFLF